ncbi:MAG: imidazoleglycerol-phosphate dehydratase HisB [Clostridia bacterium]|jgi:imidazoleglycerol-phosphate dehydratase|nr:imidazoleglycerol-phosphate dehydratase HisB [Clostridia bacterium]
MRKGSVVRSTNETDINLELSLEGDGALQGKSGIGFFDHMLTLFCKHSGFGLTLQASGDTGVDFHHTVEDLGLCLGEAYLRALGDKAGISRYASLFLPMDEALVLCAVDISGRPGLYFEIEFTCEKIGEFDTELVREFWLAFANTAKITIHLKQMAGLNSHHVAEAVFKGMGRALKAAAEISGGGIPSSKGVL